MLKYTFDKIETAEQAYWLGFLYADGYNDNRGIRLCISRIDIEHVKKFRDFMGSVHKIRETGYMYKPTNKYVESSTIDIYSREVSRNLTRLGCFKGKSLTLQPPSKNSIPKGLIRDFIRGYFDGDGCVSKLLTGNYAGRYDVSLLGTEELLLWIGQQLQETGIRFALYPYRKISRMQVVNIDNQIEFILYLYGNPCDVYLDRKYQKLVEWGWIVDTRMNHKLI